LIRRQAREPGEKIFFRERMSIFDREILLAMTCKQVDSHYFLVGEHGFGTIAVSLAAESQLKIIQIADIQINMYLI
jgi:hypothetical protein